MTNESEPTARYGAVVVDPPWPYNRATGGYPWRKGRLSGTPRPMLDYATLSLAQIGSLPISRWAMADAFVFVWTTQRYLPRTYPLVEGWGFRPSQLLVWCKAPRGFAMGGAPFGINTEFVLLARRGKPKPLRRVPCDWFAWPRSRRHSEKPDAFYDMVQTTFDGPYLDVFARRQRLGWDVYGDEVEGSIR